MGRVVTILIWMMGWFGTAMASQDPTAPLEWTPPAQVRSQSAPVREPELQSIICMGKQACHAVLDNQTVKAGDQVSGYHIVSISPQEVVLSRAGKLKHVSLFSDEIKK